jgi:hypothetical protein
VRVPHEQSPSNVIFQSPDVLAHARLRETKLAACIGKTPGSRNGRERIKPDRIEHDALLSKKTITVNTASGVPDRHGWN